MKSLLILIMAVLTVNFASAQANICKDFKTGVFQFTAFDGGVYTIIRTDTTQYERHSRQATYTTMKIRWDSDCHYTLSDRVQHRRGRQPIKDIDNVVAGNILGEFIKPNKITVKTYFTGQVDTVETVFTKLDVSEYYNNIFQLKQYAEYKNSDAYGQTLLGDIHSVAYYQSHKNAKKYLITFETTFHGEEMNMTRLLDSKVVTVRKDQQVANSNCRYNGEYDDEVVAIYQSDHEEKEAKIIRAFRCNRTTEKIEELDINNVNYKTSDRNRITW